VSIEARFVVVSSSFLNRIGIDLDFYFNLGSTLGANPLGGANPNRVIDPFTGGTVGTTPGGYSTARALIDGQLANGSWDGRADNQHWTPIGVFQDSRPWTSTARTGVGSDIGSTLVGNGIGLAGTFLDDVQVDFLLEATQADETSRTLTAPRITLFNGQRAYITVATQRAYVASYEPVVGDSSSALRPIIGYVPTGTVLDVEATVSADRRYVTMTIRPQVARDIGNRQITFSFSSSGGGGFGGVTVGSATIDLPTVAVQDLQTTVSVPDGGTLLLGGQRIAGEMDREMGAPVLSKVPLLNRLFTNRMKVRDEQTLLILVKPRIIIQRDEEELAKIRGDFR